MSGLVRLLRRGTHFRAPMAPVDRNAEVLAIERAVYAQR